MNETYFFSGPYVKITKPIVIVKVMVMNIIMCVVATSSYRSVLLKP